MHTLFSIGEFSRITGLPIKTIRFYHEKGLIIPSYIDHQSGYRYYDKHSLEKAAIISKLKEFNFSLNEISEILLEADSDRDILLHLENQKRRIQENINRSGNIINQIDQIIITERENRTMAEESSNEVVEKECQSTLVAGIRITGKYSDCGKAFGTLGRKVGRYISGKAMNLYYDCEYKEDDADFEPCFPISKRVEKEGIHVHEIPAGKCLSLIHVGPYEELGRSYAKVLDFVHQKDLKTALPSREIYVKGPGMIFKGNPKKYVTEIQIPLS